MEKTIEIPEGYKARVEGNKVILEKKKNKEAWIPKEILKYLIQKGDYRVCWATWLEKQIEQKEIFDVDKFFVGKDVTDFKKELFFLIRGARELKPTDEEIWLNIENQIAHNLIDILQEYQKPLPQANSEAKYYFDEWIKRQPIPKYWNAFLAGIDFNKKQQQPAEWSEEDEMHLANAILAAEKEFGVDSCTANFLKSMHPSWKPSELEKGALRTAIHILTEERNFPKAAAQIQNILNAFEDKESRKDWKPSKEQMEALAKACIGDTLTTKWDVLNSLYDDLQKLIQNEIC